MGNTNDKEPNDGGYDADFDPPLPDDLTCCICLLAFRDPMQLACGHQYCRSCLDKYSRNQGVEFTCPVDRRRVVIEEIFPDKALERKVLSLTVKCVNLQNACQWIGELRELEYHIRDCPFIYINCAKCFLPILKLYFDDHVSHKCDFLVLSCGLCGDNYLLKDEQDHNSKCKYCPISCVNDCGEEIRRNEMDSHLKVCPSSVQSCFYADLGCTFKGTLNQRDVMHENSNVQNHLKLAVEKIYVLEKELTLTKEKNESLEREVTVQKILLEIHMKESMKNQNNMHNRLEILEKESKETIRSLTDRLNMQERHTEEKVRSREEKLLINKTPLQNNSNLQGTSSMHMYAAKNVETCPTKVGILNEGSPIAKALREVKKSKYGVFIWKIDNYEQGLKEARQTDKCIYSEPFFTSEFGYKLRLEAWLNGNSVGKGTCLSLYIRIIPGPHDDRLQWPFSYMNTLSILNQIDEALHRERTCDPSEAVGATKELCFGRPIYSQNKGCGCGTLITHQNVVNNGFVVDNTIYFMCKIYGE